MSTTTSDAAEPMGPPIEATGRGSGEPPEFPQVMGHPRPLWMLFMTEFWERFAFYGIRWALVLYIVAAVLRRRSGDGEAPASRIYGAYLALVYAAAIFGGYVADRIDRLPALDPARRGDHGRRPVHDRVAGPDGVQARPGHGHRRQRPVQAEHLDHGRQALRADATSAAIRGFTIFYMGINLGALHRAAR